MAGQPHRLAALAITATLALMLAAPAAAAPRLEDADGSAYATGTVVHAHVGEQPGDPEAGEPATRGVDAEVAFSGAAVDSGGLREQIANELGRVVIPAKPEAKSYGRGSAIEAGGGQEVPGGENQVVIAGLVEATAPPTTDADPAEVGPIPADPIAYASTARGDAYASWPSQLGADLAYGLGYVENAEVADAAGSDAENSTDESLEEPLVATNAAGDRAVSWSTSTVTCSGAEGLVAETRQTIAPVTFLAGTPTEFTIELAGEWVLRASANGQDGGATVHYGPGEASPETPVLRVLTPPEEEGGEPVTEVQLTTQDLLQEDGLVIDALPLANIVVGEDPRAIGQGPDSEPQVAADGTLAAAAVDVVRVELLSEEGTGELAEVRIGHMEVRSAVQAGGVACGELGLDKSVDRELVSPGDEFTYTIRVTNPNPCTLIEVRVEDMISADEGIEWEVLSTEPQADEVSDTRVVWNDIGPIESGGAKDVSIRIRVSEDSRAGRFRDLARATALCGDQPVEGEDEADLGVPLEAEVTLDLPEVGGPGARRPNRPADLPATGGPVLVALSGLTALGGVWLLRRRR